VNAAVDLYLDLLKKILVNTIYRDPRIDADPQAYDEAARLIGKDWPRDAHTMVGMKRLDNLDRCCRTVIQESVPGDFIETGVWRGGSSIFMRGVLKAYGVTDRRVLVADSFQGLPPPDEAAFPADTGDHLHSIDYLRVSLEQAQENFRRYGLLDEQVTFVKGWFKDTLPTAPTKAIAVMRLDGDMYESTWQALEALYPKASPGAFVIIDDYGAIEACAAAVGDFRRKFAVTAPLEQVDWTGAVWRKPI
jgi:hypothetical protein